MQFFRFRFVANILFFLCVIKHVYLYSLFPNVHFHKASIRRSPNIKLSDLQSTKTPQQTENFPDDIPSPSKRSMALTEEFPKIYFAATHFVKKFQHPFIHRPFIVPKTNEWPAELHGYR
jgi:hypothetical protein